MEQQRATQEDKDGVSRRAFTIHMGAAAAILKVGAPALAQAPAPATTRPRRRRRRTSFAATRKDHGAGCGSLHYLPSLEIVVQQRQDLAGWREIVDRMEGNGMLIFPEEKQAILDYLVTSLGP